jgi:hypothetical protein
MKEDKPTISCPTFQTQEPVIERIIAKVNGAKDIAQKAELAGELHEEVEVLVSCPEYDEKSADCNKCRLIANVRDKTATLIMKTKRLA